MARRPRYPALGYAQHVIQRGIDRCAIFAAPNDYRFYHDCLLDACRKFGCTVHAYVFMTNHVHLLITPGTPTGVSQVMQSVGRRYVRRFNDTYQRTGGLWEDRHRATVVDHERYLFACYRYIEFNPVRARLASEPRAYRWSSHHANAFGADDAIVSPHDSYVALGESPAERQRAYRALCGDPIPDATISEIRTATRSGWALGAKHFHDEIARLLGRRTTPATRGRPPATK